MSKAEETFLIGNFALTIPMPPNGANLQLSGQIISTDDFGSLSKKIDLLREVGDRQLKVAALGTLVAQRKANMEQLESARAIFAEKVELQKKGRKLSQQERNIVQNGQSSIDQIVRNIESIEKNIADIKKETAL